MGESVGECARLGAGQCASAQDCESGGECVALLFMGAPMYPGFCGAKQQRASDVDGVRNYVAEGGDCRASGMDCQVGLYCSASMGATTGKCAKLGAGQCASAQDCESGGECVPLLLMGAPMFPGFCMAKQQRGIRDAGEGETCSLNGMDCKVGLVCAMDPNGGSM